MGSTYSAALSAFETSGLAAAPFNLGHWSCTVRRPSEGAWTSAARFVLVPTHWEKSSKFLEKIGIVLLSSKRPNSDPWAPALTDTPALASTQPCTPADTDARRAGTACTIFAPAPSESSRVELTSVSKKMVADALPANAETPKLSDGMRCAVSEPVAVTFGETEMSSTGATVSTMGARQRLRERHTVVVGRRHAGRLDRRLRREHERSVRDVVVQSDVEVHSGGYGEQGLRRN
jgi:hypothetical protein